MADELAELREAIAEVDRALLELLRRRLELASRVGTIKAEAGMPVVVRDVEERVLTRAREHAASFGVSEEVMAEVFQAVIRGSVERQHRVGVKLRAARGGRVLILGAAGDMGGWLTGFLALGGHRVDGVDPAWAGLPAEPGRYPSLEAAGALDAYQHVVLAVPLDRTPEVLDAVVARRPSGLVVEIASIKSHLEPALERARAAGVQVACLHPMFGPGKSPYEPLTWVLACRGDAEAARAAVAPLLVHPYTHLVAMPFPHHDRLMGWLLGLAHLTGMLFGAALTASGLDPEELSRCASTTFSRQAATAASVLVEDPDLYFDIQRLNPHRRGVYQAVAAGLEELVGLVEGDDRDGFRRALAAARNALGS